MRLAATPKRKRVSSGGCFRIDQFGFVEQTKQKPVEYSRSRTFSDGLSTFSVFIEALNSSVGDVDEKSPRIAMVSDGTAVSARYVDTKKGIFQLTVIGELPLDTVKKISDQLLVK